MKRVLISAGSIYSSLDDNKILSNRARGIWAVRFAQYLAGLHLDYKITLLIPDIMVDVVELHHESKVIRHKGYHDYAALCEKLAPEHDAAILAGAVINFIPVNPVKGKMSTAGMKEGDVINIPFILAPRVINKMKTWNPNITLIGCKLLSGSTHEDLIEAAYHVILDARCNAVIANDMSDLKAKHIVYQDRSVQTFSNDFESFTQTLTEILQDEHYRTEIFSDSEAEPKTKQTFDALVEQHRARFVKRSADSDRVFGAVAVRMTGLGWLLSPREKGEMFSSKDAVKVLTLDTEKRTILASGKASLNAPLLIRVGEKYRASAVLHFHEMLPGLPTVPYAPPGTVRDNNREIPGPNFNIEGHGCILCVPSLTGQAGEILT